MDRNSHNPWHSRGYLPHYDGSDFQFVTFRLADSIPQTVLKRWRGELSGGEITDSDLRRRIEAYLDQGYGACHLRDRRVATVLIETLNKFDGARYMLIAWVIMPNHAHILIRLLNNESLSAVMHSIKSYTATESNRILNHTGRFWFKESYDRFIRDEEHFYNTIRYIENNPVKARLCEDPSDWEFGSAYNKLV